jgi:phosphomannomutase
VRAIVHAPFLGMTAGAALADVLTGAVSPSARTTLTWYEDLGAALPPLGDYGALYRSTYRYAPAGVRVTFPDGWGLIRASNTQPILVLRYEASTEGRLREIQALIEGTLAQVKKELGA